MSSSQVVTVGPQDSLLTALQRMLDEEVDHLPVVDDRRLAGICTRSDILRARHGRFALEHPQRGWISPRLPVSSSPRGSNGR